MAIVRAWMDWLMETSKASMPAQCLDLLRRLVFLAGSWSWDTIPPTTRSHRWACFDQPHTSLWIGSSDWLLEDEFYRLVSLFVHYQVSFELLGPSAGSSRADVHAVRVKQHLRARVRGVSEGPRLLEAARSEVLLPMFLAFTASQASKACSWAVQTLASREKDTDSATLRPNRSHSFMCIV